MFFFSSDGRSDKENKHNLETSISSGSISHSSDREEMDRYNTTIA
jgi:hypothetical protein